MPRGRPRKNIIEKKGEVVCCRLDFTTHALIKNLCSRLDITIDELLLRLIDERLEKEK